MKLKNVKVADTALMPGRLGIAGFELSSRPSQCLQPIKWAACERVFEMTLEYANSRVQFGLPIGRFQRVQDHVIQIVNLKDARPVEHLRGLVEARMRKSPTPDRLGPRLQSRGQRGLLPGVQRRPRSPRRRGHNARVRVDPSHPNVENSIPLLRKTPSITRPGWPRSWGSNPRLYGPAR